MRVNMGKFKFTVVFGKEACNYVDEHGVKATVEALETGELEALDGMWRTYEMDTEEDVKQLLQALDDAWGWDASTFDMERRPDGTFGVKYEK